MKRFTIDDIIYYLFQGREIELLYNEKLYFLEFDHEYHKQVGYEKARIILTDCSGPHDVELIRATPLSILQYKFNGKDSMWENIDKFEVACIL